MAAHSNSVYRYHDAAPSHTHKYLWPAVFQQLTAIAERAGDRRVFDLGCGNGSFAAALAERGFDVIGVDPSETGIRLAQDSYPHVRFARSSSDDPLASIYGRFPAVVSLEVIEHVYAPREFARSLHALLEERGTAIVSTPYHGYWKNLALAVTGKMDAHFTALWDGGHIKFWSRKSLTTLLVEAGFEKPEFIRVGRVPALAKSMIAVARRRVE